MPGRKPPKYIQIADGLRASIDAGEYGPGDQLPGETTLASAFSASPMTVRRALDVLKADGIIEAKWGTGVFVRQQFAPIRRHGIQRLARDRWGSGASIWSTDETRELVVDQLRVEETAAPTHIAAVLELGEGQTACLRSRRFVIAGRPVLLSRSFLPQALVLGSAITQPDTGPGGTYARLAELDHAPVHFREELRVRKPSTNEVELLELPIVSPVIQLVRTAWTAERRVIEVNEMVLDASVYVLDYEFDA
ncbi:GntR family transcriptional regulator [Streptomyces sp. BPTC-684]|uniref:GntR family transcriptional regulator n=1 Tax=Streptomyces sp. BPTC-684 TaxID=3043734 RepID=UPI0024B1F770|nr:GntR family transcriptional regulator [Streptomyces sp. BPTC-684]WHM41128.1 GntR family transcriptional regulator [Streptomyces sp. BPTC-684]